jgi:hypothetical protein
MVGWRCAWRLNFSRSSIWPFVQSPANVEAQVKSMSSLRMESSCTVRPNMDVDRVPIILGGPQCSKSRGLCIHHAGTLEPQASLCSCSIADRAYLRTSEREISVETQAVIKGFKKFYCNRRQAMRSCIRWVLDWFEVSSCVASVLATLDGGAGQHCTAVRLYHGCRLPSARGTL